MTAKCDILGRPPVRRKPNDEIKMPGPEFDQYFQPLSAKKLAPYTMAFSEADTEEKVRDMARRNR